MGDGALAHGIAHSGISVIDRRGATRPRRRTRQRCSREREPLQHSLLASLCATTAYQRCAALAQRWRSEFCSQQRCTARAATS